MSNVIVYGSNDFCGTLPQQIRSASSDRIYRTESLNEATSLILSVLPDVIIIQASFDGRQEFCSWLREHSNLLWIHVIILEDRPQFLALSAQQKIAADVAAIRQGVDTYIFWHYLKEDVDSILEKNYTEQLLIEQYHRGLSKAQHSRLLSTIAYTDTLTGLHNRRALERDLAAQIEKARSCGTPLSVIMVELDCFKQVNDNYGHEVGDRVLQQLSCRLRYSLQSDGTIYRYMGDEFVITSYRTCEETLDVARRLHITIGEEPFLIDGKDDVLPIQVTLSIGVTCLQPDDDFQGQSLLKRADDHMYKVKKAGGNSVVGCSSCLSHDEAQAIAIFER